MPDTTREPFQTIWDALQRRQFFKLICGGSFSDPDRLSRLIRAYAQTPIAAVDVGATLPVVAAAIDALAAIPEPPVLMVSFPLDADPHFRKIELVEPDCIRCGACIPVCPTQVFALPSSDSPLQVDEPVCYGCGRCVPVCPTDALKLDPFSVYPELVSVLSLPQVQAVEIHSSFADPDMIDALYADLGDYLEDKLISICFRPQLHPLGQSLDLLARLKARTPFPLIVQVDGEPMSGSDRPEASLPALEAARGFAPHLPSNCFLTISGGINDRTADYLKQPEYRAVQGVGMGTFARQWVWSSLANPQAAGQLADTLVRRFQSATTSSIM